jgi:hypothetical protein
MSLLAFALLAQSIVSQQASAAAQPATPVLLPGVVRTELAGISMSAAPHFDFVTSFVEGGPMQIAVDPVRHPQIVGANAYLYIVRHKTPEQWLADPTLVEVRSAAQAVFFPGPDIQNCTVAVQFGPVPGNNGVQFGVDYDLVLDLNFNTILDEGDLIDGLDGQPGMWVTVPPQSNGPYAVTEILYNGGTLLRQNIFYPANISTLGQLPLVVVSHGNGHNYQWYDHLGLHLASWGFVVMSHENNTGPGPDAASQTTLSNTDHFLGNLATIGGGALQGHVDNTRIAWIGHSRGGEGVARAYDRLFDGTNIAVNYTRSAIKLVSSIAPTDFLGPASAYPHDANYHLWVGGADSDVTGCADCNICQSFHLLDRAEGTSHSISLHGVGHGAFHNGGGDLWASGPCIVSRADTHVLMKAHLLPLLQHYIFGAPAAKDFFVRQWETFAPPGVPGSSCVVVDLQYTQGPALQPRVIDNFQTQNATNLSSSGAAVTFTVDNLTEARLDDLDSAFTASGSDVMNGMTMGAANDTTRGIVFQWTNADRDLMFEVPAGQRDLRGFEALSFRAAQCARDANTTATLGDLSFQVALRDESGRRAQISIRAYGGGIEEPYQRTGCGTGAGWANEFETIRIPLRDFRRVQSQLDLSRIDRIEFLFGPSYGDARGRLGLDDVEFHRP